MYKGHDDENYPDLSDPVENFRYLMDLSNQALFNPYIPPPLPENKLVSKQKLNIGTLHLDAPNIKDLDEVARNIRPELERAIYDFDILPRIERPDCIPPEITMNFAMIGVQTDATDARGLADAIIARMRDLFVEEINRQANHAAFYKEKNGWWPWEEGRPGPHAAEIKALFPDMARNPQDEGIYWFDEMLVSFDDSPQEQKAHAYFREALERRGGLEKVKNLDTGLWEVCEEMCARLRNDREAAKAEGGLLDELKELAEDGVELLAPKAAHADELEPGDLIDNIILPLVKEHREDARKRRDYGLLGGKDDFLADKHRDYGILGGKDAFLIDKHKDYGAFGGKDDSVGGFKLRDLQSPANILHDHNTWQFNRFGFAYSHDNLKYPWQGQRRVDFSDPETVEVLLRKEKLLPAFKMILAHQLDEDDAAGMEIFKLEELREKLKANPPSEWDDETLSEFAEIVKEAESFIEEATILKDKDGNDEKGYTVGYGAFIPMERGPGGEYTQSEALNKLIDNTKDGISKVTVTYEEAEEILKESIIERNKDIAEELPLTKYLDKLDQMIIMDMVYNMSIDRVKGFKRFIGCLFDGNRVEAGWEILDSKYREQVSGRSLYNALRMATRIKNLNLNHYKDKWINEKWGAKSKAQLKAAYYSEVEELLRGR